MWYGFLNPQISISRFLKVSCLFVLTQSRAQVKGEAIDIVGQQALDKLREVGKQLLQKCRELQEEYSNPKTGSKQALETEIENLKAELQALREGKEKPADKPTPPDRTNEMVKAVTEFARAAIIEVERTAADGTIAVTNEKEGRYYSKERFWVSEIKQEKSRTVKALEYIIDDMRDLAFKQRQKEIDDDRKQAKKERDEKWNQECKERDERWAKQDEESRQMIKWFEATAKRWTGIAEKVVEKAVDEKAVDK